VYLAAANDAITAGKSVLYLVPEIGLAAQAADMLRGRFGASAVTLWHSDLPLKRRREAWWAIRRQECPIVVGARSASLVPLENIGLIVVDEEQDTAFKEERKPRFHARDVALKRGQDHGAVVVFGSATPSLEVFHMAITGGAALIELNERAVAAAAPVARLVDLKTDKPRGGSLSSTLRNALSERLKKHEQAILFLNRRGFHRFLRCPHCGWVARCDRCGIAFIHHKGAPAKPAPPETPDDPKKRKKRAMTGGLTCHLCGNHAPIPAACPECGHTKLHAGGTGTERLAEEILEEFPWAKAIRWDSDSASRAGTHESLYRDFAHGKADILIGTQVVAQGFNFPNVTLVGVVDADQPLHLPDFRAAERAFQHVLQVGGRAGRELVTGDVIIQTRSADHYALIHAARSDYAGFAEEELRFREDLNYPPFSHIILVRTESKDRAKAETDIQRLLAWIQEGTAEPPIGALGPAPAHGPRGKSKQLQCLLKIPAVRFDAFLTDFRAFLGGGGGKFWVDVDPENVF
jgi:primosomal protein N' (replication factor Y) (superfamily II helicase)